MNRAVHEIRLGAVRALIWEDYRSDELNYRVSVARVVRPGEQNARADQFDADDLPVLAEVLDLAHLWICEQAELIA
jgi:hypothetical protein